MFEAGNLKKAALVVIVVMIVENLTAKQSTVIRVGAMGIGTLAALHFGAKL